MDELQTQEIAPAVEAKPKKTAQKAAALYRVIEPLTHDGKAYLIGEDVEIGEKDAQTLLDLEVIEVR